MHLFDDLSDGIGQRHAVSGRLLVEGCSQRLVEERLADNLDRLTLVDGTLKSWSRRHRRVQPRTVAEGQVLDRSGVCVIPLNGGVVDDEVERVLGDVQRAVDEGLVRTAAADTYRLAVE